MNKIILRLLFLFAVLSNGHSFSPVLSWSFGRAHAGGVFQHKNKGQVYSTLSFIEFSVKDSESGFSFECSPFYYSGIINTEKEGTVSEFRTFLLNAHLFYNTLEYVTPLCSLSPFIGIRLLNISDIKQYRFEAGVEFLLHPPWQPVSQWKAPLIFKVLSLRSGFRLDSPAKPAFFCEAGIDIAGFIYIIGQSYKKQTAAPRRNPNAAAQSI